MPEQNFFDLDIDQFQKVVDLNLLGTVLPTKIFCDVMARQKKGVIINIASMLSFQGGLRGEIGLFEPGNVHSKAGWEQAYEQVFSLSYLEEPIEILHWKVDVSGPAPHFDNRWSQRARKANGDARKGARRAYFAEAGGFVDCPVYDRYALAPGAVLEGPALVEERESTCVLGVGDKASIDDFGNMIAEIGGHA